MFWKAPYVMAFAIGVIVAYALISGFMGWNEGGGDGACGALFGGIAC